MGGEIKGGGAWKWVKNGMGFRGSGREEYWSVVDRRENDGHNNNGQMCVCVNFLFKGHGKLTK